MGKTRITNSKQFWRNYCEERANKLKFKSYEYDEEDNDRRIIRREESKRKNTQMLKERPGGEGKY